MTEQAHAVIYSVGDSIAHITLNRPEKKNALNDELISGLKKHLTAAGSDEGIRAVVITGAGNDFCSGADLSALQTIADASVAKNSEDAASLMELFLQIREVRTPVVAAVRGRALAGGCGLASACDIVLASSNARFGYPEVKIGFVPAMVLAILRRNVSEKRAFELVTRGSEIGAEEAKELGLVNHMFSDNTFDDDVAAYMSGFQKLSGSALALTKSLLYQMDGMAFAEALASGVDVNVIARMTEDCRAGISRFLKKA